MLQLFRRGCIEPCEGTFDVPRYGYINVSVLIIPVNADSTVEGAGVVACCCVFYVDGIL